jgi:hypothetical protein
MDAEDPQAYGTVGASILVASSGGPHSLQSSAFFSLVLK